MTKMCLECGTRKVSEEDPYGELCDECLKARSLEHPYTGGVGIPQHDDTPHYDERDTSIRGRL